MRKYVEHYAESQAWEKLGIEQQIEAGNQLPSELADEDQDGKQFDLLRFRLQLAILGHERWRRQMIEIAGLLGGKSSIPMVHSQIVPIRKIQKDGF
jgi:hypothetical protein